MSDTTLKSSEELAAELEKLMPQIKSAGSGWGIFRSGNAVYSTQKLYQVAQLVLTQQEEIRHLKAELDELKNR